MRRELCQSYLYREYPQFVVTEKHGLVADELDFPPPSIKMATPTFQDEQNRLTPQHHHRRHLQQKPYAVVFQKSKHEQIPSVHSPVNSNLSVSSVPSFVDQL